ncbi:MAG TPA: sensor histidine kinase [Gaiellaceae bacterium]|nr:sensor histidine kinase [Gaiellaceae bacterium]
MDTSDIEPLLVELRRLLSGRPGRVVLTSVLVLATVLEALLAKDVSAKVLEITIALNVLAVAALLLARRWPTLAALAATVVTVVLVAHRTPLSIMPFCVMLFLFVRLVIQRGLLFAAPLLIPFLVLATPRFDGANAGFTSDTTLLFLAGALIVGESLRKRGLAVAELDATQEAMAESTRARTVMEERARIARELHDIVAHHLSVIAIESEVARRTSPELSSEAGGRLEAIASTAREALTETRRLLGVLREDTAGEADRAPQPGLDDLDDLIAKAEASGTPVRLIRQGKVVRLPLSIDLAAYRIIQEALTNARRHAPGANVDVEVSYRDEMLQLRVRDYGPGAPGGEPVEGHGLMGMRERAALASGTFASGPAEEGGFEVEITLPISEPTP